MNPAAEVHIRRLHIPEDYNPSFPDTSMSSIAAFTTSPTLSTIEDVLLDTEAPAITTTDDDHRAFSAALTSFIGPICGRVSPYFLEDQVDGELEELDHEGEH